MHACVSTEVIASSQTTMPIQWSKNRGYTLPDFLVASLHASHKSLQKHSVLMLCSDVGYSTALIGSGYASKYTV